MNHNGGDLGCMLLIIALSPVNPCQLSNCDWPQCKYFFLAPMPQTHTHTQPHNHSRQFQSRELLCHYREAVAYHATPILQTSLRPAPQTAAEAQKFLNANLSACPGLKPTQSDFSNYEISKIALAVASLH